MKALFRITFSIFLISITLCGCSTVEKYNLKFTLRAPDSFSPRYEEEWDDISSVLDARLKSFGLSEEKFKVEFNKPEFTVSIFGADTSDLQIIKGILTTPGKIEFWETYENREVFDFLIGSDQDLKMKIIENSGKAKDTSLNSIIDPADIPTLDSVPAMPNIIDEIKGRIPFYSLISPNLSFEGIPNQSCLVGYAISSDTSSINAYLNSSDSPSSLPNDIIFCWSQKPVPFDTEGKLFELHALKSSGNHQKYALDGSVIANSVIEGGRNTSMRILNIEMNLEGATVFSDLTRKNQDRCIAILMDGKVITYPRVMSTIEDGKIQISADLDITDLRILSTILNSFPGVMPARLEMKDLSIDKP